ncbi:MAG: ABC transporter substrate-binding protein [Marinifilaceae bacterium]
MMRVRVLLVLLFIVSGGYSWAQKVVSLAPNITHMLIELGEEENIVGCTKYCITQRDIPRVADALNANVERIAALKPDYVLAGGLTHPRIVASIEKMGIKCVHMKQPDSFDEMCEQMLQIGNYLGCEAKANALNKECNERLSKLSFTKGMDKKKRMFLQLNTNPLYTILGDSFLDDFINKLGGESVSRNLKSGQISVEFVLNANPDVIIVTTMGGLGQSEVDRWKKYGMLKAVKAKKVFLVDEYALCSPTPLTFIKTLEHLYQFIYE